MPRYTITDQGAIICKQCGSLENLIVSIDDDKRMRIYCIWCSIDLIDANEWRDAE